MGLQYEMRARVKSVYSIWNKMESKGVAFEDIYDIYAVRIIFDPLPGVDEKNQCWDIYSAITDIYRIRPDRIRDWVSRPKANGYQALHLTVMGPDGQWVEIQIRSRRMDDIAEKGFAAHWNTRNPTWRRIRNWINGYKPLPRYWRVRTRMRWISWIRSN